MPDVQGVGDQVARRVRMLVQADPELGRRELGHLRGALTAQHHHPLPARKPHRDSVQGLGRMLVGPVRGQHEQLHIRRPPYGERALHRSERVASSRGKR